MNHMDFVIESWNENRKYFENYIDYGRKIKEIVRKKLEDAEVYIFGSVVEGRSSPASDIDVLIVSKKMPSKQSERAMLTALILKEIDLYAPFEFHLVNLKEFNWYKRFIRKLVRIE